MDHISLQQQKAMAEEKNFQTLKKVTKLLFSLSLFSFVFALPSWLPFHLFHSPNLHFHLFHQPIDKNCMFLLCNGLLVFLANYSGLFKTLASSRRNYDSFKVYDQFGPLSDSTMMLEAEKPLLERDAIDHVSTIHQENKGEEESRDQINIHEVSSQNELATREVANFYYKPSLGPLSFQRGILNNGHLASSTTGGETEEMVISGGDEEDIRSDLFVVERAEVDDTTLDEEGNSGVLSDEELNRKFDEFIKRMKEEITIDARRTLVVV